MHWSTQPIALIFDVLICDFDFVILTFQFERLNFEVGHILGKICLCIVRHVYYKLSKDCMFSEV